MIVKEYYEPAELLALQELDEVMRALKLNDTDVIELLLDDLKPHQQGLVNRWYNEFQKDNSLEEAEKKYEERFL